MTTPLPPYPSPFPGDSLEHIPRCTVQAAYTRPNGYMPGWGTVTFKPSQVAITKDPNGSNLVPQGPPIMYKVRPEGVLIATLMVTGETWWEEPWYWEVHQTINGEKLPKAWLSLPEKCTDVVDLLQSIRWEKPLS